MDEGENQASDGRREGRGTASEKFYWRPVAPTDLGHHECRGAVNIRRTRCSGASAQGRPGKGKVLVGRWVSDQEVSCGSTVNNWRCSGVRFHGRNEATSGGTWPPHSAAKNGDKFHFRRRLGNFDNLLRAIDVVGPVQMWARGTWLNLVSRKISDSCNSLEPVWPSFVRGDC